MKILHLADLHIGKSLGDFDLLDDQRYILDEILSVVEKQSVTAVLLAGDIYDRPIPSEGAVRLLDYFLHRLEKLGTKVFMISGNHDSDERLNFGAKFFAARGIYIAAKYDGLYTQQLTEGALKVNFYLLPFIKASQVRHRFPEAKIENYHEAIEAALAEKPVNKDEVNIILSHQFVAGYSASPELSGSEGAATQNVGLVEQVGAELFGDFDYVALGHIHRPQQIGREYIRYAGSPLKYSLSECNMAKSMPLITIESKDKINIELLPLVPRRDLRHLTGPLSQLIARENLRDTDDYIYATLTDEEVQDNAMNILQSYYPNTVKLDYKNSHTQALQEENFVEASQFRSFEELLGDFYKFIYGQEISDEEMALMQEIGKKAGVVHEAD